MSKTSPPSDYVAPEFSRLVDCRNLSSGPVRHIVEANAAERDALARRFGLLALDELRAELELTRNLAGRVRLAGTLFARVVQACVITLEPVAAAIQEEFTEYFADLPPDSVIPADLPLDDEDAPEALIEGHLDLGETVAQHLVLALEPYPRVPGAGIDERYAGTDEPSSAGAGSPFAALARPRDRDRSR